MRGSVRGPPGNGRLYLKGCVARNFTMSTDPLDLGLLKSLVDKRREDKLSDYKESFSNDSKHWADISKDCVAFANYDGGHLVFGVTDGDFKVKGLTDLPPQNRTPG